MWDSSQNFDPMKMASDPLLAIRIPRRSCSSLVMTGEWGVKKENTGQEDVFFILD